MGKFKRSARNQRLESDAQEALPKIYRYCAYQERSHQDVKKKLFEYGLLFNQVDEILSHLITEGFLNEERYAKAFAGGKFRIMKWGKLKIRRELETAGVSPRNITTALAEISMPEYSKALFNLIEKKSGQIEEENNYKKKSKVASFVIGKGYEPELVWDTINDFLA